MGPHLPDLLFLNKIKHRSVTWGPKHIRPEFISHQLPKKFSSTWSQPVGRSRPNTQFMRKAETRKGFYFHESASQISRDEDIQMSNTWPGSSATLKHFKAQSDTG